MLAGQYIDKDIYDRGFDNVFGNEAEEKHIRSSLMKIKDMEDPVEFIDIDTSGRGLPLNFNEEHGKLRKFSWKRIRTIEPNSALKKYARKTKAFLKSISGKRKHQKDIDDHDQSSNKVELDNGNTPGNSTDNGTLNGSFESQPKVLCEVERDLSPGETTTHVSESIGVCLHEYENLIQNEEGGPHFESDTSKDTSLQNGHASSEAISSEEKCTTSIRTTRGILSEGRETSKSSAVNAAHAACCGEVVTSDHESSPGSKCVNKVGSPSLVSTLRQDIEKNDDLMEHIARTRLSEASQDIHESCRPSQDVMIANANRLLETTFQNVMNETTRSVGQNSMVLRVTLMAAKFYSRIADFSTMLKVGLKNTLTVIKKCIKAILQVTYRMLGIMSFLQFTRRIRTRRMTFERVVLVGMRIAIFRILMATKRIGQGAGGWLYFLFLSGIVRRMIRLISVSD